MVIYGHNIWHLRHGWNHSRISGQYSARRFSSSGACIGLMLFYLVALRCLATVTTVTTVTTIEGETASGNIA